MGTRSSYDPGVFCYIDLLTSDVEAASRFYREVFGWEEQVEPNGYRVFLHDGGVVAGAMTPPDGIDTPAWCTHVAVTDLTQTVERARSLGATTIIEPTEIGTAGGVAGITDPTGAAIYFWRAGDKHGSAVVNQPGTWTWSDLMTRRPDEATAFYGDLLGWGYEEPEGDNEYRVIRHHGRQIGGILRMPAEIPEAVGASWEPYFNVGDLEATLGRVKEAGGIQPMDVMEVPDVGRFTICHDPQGASFIVIQAEEWDE